MVSLMARSITSLPHPPPYPLTFAGVFLVVLPHGGAFAKENQSGGGALSKTTPPFGL